MEKTQKLLDQLSNRINYLVDHDERLRGLILKRLNENPQSISNDVAPDDLLESKHIGTFRGRSHRDSRLRKAWRDPDQRERWAKARRAGGGRMARLERDFDSKFKGMLFHMERNYSLYKGDHKHAEAPIEQPITLAKLRRRATLRGKAKTHLTRVNAEVKAIKKMFRDSYHKAFLYGIQSGGVGGKFDTQRHLSLEELRWVDSAVKHEMRFFNRLVRDIKAGRPVVTMLRHRIEMYSKSLRSAYNAGSVMATPDTVLIHWKMGKAEHCSDCIELERSSPFTKYTLPCMSGETEVCTLIGTYTVEELALGRYPYKEIYVWSYDAGRGHPVPGRVEKVVSVGVSPTVVVTIDGGSSVIVTPDHPFLTLSGGYVRADELVAETLLRKFDWKMDRDGYVLLKSSKSGRKVVSVVEGPVIPVFDLVVVPHHNFALGVGIFTHNTTPKAGGTRCLSNCKCSLVYEPANAKRVRETEKKNLSRSYLLRRIKQRRG